MNRILKENATVPLFFAQTLIASLRDVGYNMTTSALCEHVDNAIEAGANEIRIYFRQRGSRRQLRDRRRRLRQRPRHVAKCAEDGHGVRRLDAIRQPGRHRPFWHGDEDCGAQHEPRDGPLLLAGAGRVLQNDAGCRGHRQRLARIRSTSRTPRWSPELPEEVSASFTETMVFPDKNEQDFFAVAQRRPPGTARTLRARSCSCRIATG